MRLNNKGSLYYEALICLIIVITFVNYTMIYQSQLRIEINKNREEYRMKQLLYANMMLLEANEELLVGNENYRFIVDEAKICIEWNDLYGNTKNYCENYYK